jgi:hypothetical protein
MTLRIDAEAIHVTGHCPIEEAEALLCALQDHPQAPVDLTGLTRAHLAIVQLLLSVRPRLIGAPADALLRRLLAGGEETHIE